MQIQKLGQNWTLTVLGENVFHIPEKQIPAKVPSTVYSTLLEQNLMPDPFYRDNELDATKLCENDFAYETDFLPDASIRREDRIFLRFEGIDTLAEISLDGAVLGTAENMNRVYEFDITEAVKRGSHRRVYGCHAGVSAHPQGGMHVRLGLGPETS